MTNWTWLTFKALKSIEVSNNCLHYSIKTGWYMGVKIMKSHVEMSSLSNSQKSFNKFIISQFKCSWSRSLCNWNSTNTAQYEIYAKGFSPVKNTSQSILDSCLLLFYASFKCRPYKIFKSWSKLRVLRKYNPVSRTADHWKTRSASPSPFASEMSACPHWGRYSWSVVCSRLIRSRIAWKVWNISLQFQSHLIWMDILSFGIFLSVMVKSTFVMFRVIMVLLCWTYGNKPCNIEYSQRFQDNLFYELFENIKFRHMY